MHRSNRTIFKNKYYTNGNTIHNSDFDNTKILINDLNDENNYRKRRIQEMRFRKNMSFRSDTHNLSSIYQTLTPNTQGVSEVVALVVGDGSTSNFKSYQSK